MKQKRQLIDSAYHRNGICGAGFCVSLFRDTDGSVKIMIDFGNEENPQDNEYYAVLQVSDLAVGKIDGRWRGDHYVDEVRKLSKRNEDRKDRKLLAQLKAASPHAD